MPATSTCGGRAGDDARGAGRGGGARRRAAAILAVEEAETESEATYQELFRRLKARGLAGVDLVTSDDHRGLTAAIARHFQGASWQHCQVHFTRNLGGSSAPSIAAASVRSCAASSRPRRQPRPGRPATPGRGQAGDGAGGRSRLLRLPRRSPTAPPVDERRGTVPPGAQAADPGGAHLPQPRRLAPVSGRLGDGAERRVGQRPALPGPGALVGGAAARAGSGGRLRLLAP